MCCSSSTVAKLPKFDGEEVAKSIVTPGFGIASGPEIILKKPERNSITRDTEYMAVDTLVKLLNIHCLYTNRMYLAVEITSLSNHFAHPPYPC